MNPPFHIAVILPSGRKLPVQFDAHELAILPFHAADELDNAKHVSRDVDSIAHFQVVGVHPDRRGVEAVGAPLARQRLVAGLARGSSGRGA